MSSFNIPFEKNIYYCIGTCCCSTSVGMFELLQQFFSITPGFFLQWLRFWLACQRVCHVFICCHFLFALHSFCCLPSAVNSTIGVERGRKGTQNLIEMYWNIRKYFHICQESEQNDEKKSAKQRLIRTGDQQKTPCLLPPRRRYHADHSAYQKDASHTLYWKKRELQCICPSELWQGAGHCVCIIKWLKTCAFTHIYVLMALPNICSFVPRNYHEPLSSSTHLQNKR